MLRTPLFFGIALLLCGLISAKPAAAQVDRRHVLKSPGLVLETGAPTATCNAMMFSPDGKRLLAAGDDKTVRVWPVKDAALDTEGVTALRWANWREQRGVIYALALSPDAQNVAIGGHGLITGAVAILDTKTGQVVHAAVTPGEDKVISAVAYSPAGKQLALGTSDGSLWVWNVASPKKDDFRKLGRHSQSPENRVRLVVFLGEQDVLSVADDGSACRWSLAANAAPGRFSFELKDVQAAAVSPDGQWVAAAGLRRTDNRGCVELRSPAGQKVDELALEARTYPRRLAVDSSQTILAVAADMAPQGDLPYKPVQSQVLLYELKKRKFRPFRPESTYLVNAMALHPGGRYLAVAGGNDFEMKLWDLQAQKVVSEVRSPGSSIWGAAFSPDAKSIGLRNQRKPDPAGFNDWAGGPWKVFDLQRRDWRENENFQPLLPLETADGWRVRADARDMYLWHVVAPGGREFDLPWDRFQDVLPRCYTFLRPSDGKPARLAVGHRFGISLFTLLPGGPRRSRLFVGHADDVTSVAASADQRFLVSASRDQTLAAWSLADWSFEGELGAAFSLRGGKLWVQDIAPGSPAWEAGLTAGDEVLFLAFAAQSVPGGPAAWLDRLRRPIPGKEFFFRCRSAGKQESTEHLTHVWQRPAWKFFATRDDEWVLWRWQDYYYDTSTIGDSYIGWQIISSIDESPEFYQAEKFRNLFHRPDKLANLLASAEPLKPQPKPGPQPQPENLLVPQAERGSKLEEPGPAAPPERINITEHLPPRVELQMAGIDQQQGESRLVVRARQRVAAPGAQLESLALWINDYKFKSWKHLGGQFEERVSVPRARLRSGRNLIVAQAYNRAGVRDDWNRLALESNRPPEHRRVYGLFAGVSDYSRASRGPRRQVLWDNLLFTTDDARAMAERFRALAHTPPYQGADIRLLLELQVNRARLQAELRDLARRVGPDDLCVVFLAGHGYAREYRRNCYLPGTFAFVCPTFDVRRPSETGISSFALYEAIAAIPCRKLVLLDCCHSGSTNILRDLTPDGVGPVMIAGCGANESSYDIMYLGHGAFTNALLESLGERFRIADANHDSKLDIGELFHYLSRRVPQTVQLSKNVLGADASQHPRALIPPGELNTVIAEKSGGDHVTVDR